MTCNATADVSCISINSDTVMRAIAAAMPATLCAIALTRFSHISLYGFSSIKSAKTKHVVPEAGSKRADISILDIRLRGEDASACCNTFCVSAPCWAAITIPVSSIPTPRVLSSGDSMMLRQDLPSVASAVCMQPPVTRSKPASNRSGPKASKPQARAVIICMSGPLDKSTVRNDTVNFFSAVLLRPMQVPCMAPMASSCISSPSLSDPTS
mmetsp:Transcript_42200/g.99022  ORF Transcript_42200/g.99022 Transcript_42200/m.99022 type:complete len:211 (+) Transcript_42200:414-1046(+)